MRVGWAFNLFVSITGWFTGIGRICWGHIRLDGSMGIWLRNPCCVDRSGMDTDGYPFM